MQKKFYFASSHTTLSILLTHRFRMGLYFKEQEFKSSIEAMHICPRNKWRSVDSLKFDSYSTDSYLSRFNKARQILSIEVSIENYVIRIFRSDFRPMLMYLCKVSFLTTLTYIRLILEAVTRENKRRKHAKSDRCLIFSERSYYVFAP